MQSWTERSRTFKIRKVPGFEACHTNLLLLLLLMELMDWSQEVVEPALEDIFGLVFPSDHVICPFSEKREMRKFRKWSEKDGDRTRLL